MQFAPEAFDRLVKWQNDYTDKCNAEESDTQTAIASKLEIYAECSRGKTVGQTPQRLNWKPYTPIATQQKLGRL